MDAQLKPRKFSAKYFFWTLLAAIGTGALYMAQPVPVERPPLVVVPKPNAWSFYREAGRMHEKLLANNPGARAVDALTDPKAVVGLSKAQLAKRYPLAEKDAWIRKNEAVLKELRKGFAYSYLKSPLNPPPIPDPNLTNLRNLARLLIIESHTKSERGDWKGACRSAMDALEMGHNVSRGGGLIDALLSYAIKAIACRELALILPHLDSASARATASSMEEMQSIQASYADMLRQEKWTGIENLQSFLDNFRGPGFLLALPSSPRGISPGIFRNLRKGDILRNYTSYMNNLIEEGEKPYALRQAPELPSSGGMLKLMTDIYERPPWNHARSETHTIELRLQMALRAYKLDYGKFPERLGDLVPKYCTKVPSDPYGSGEPLRYRRMGATYLLYSIGPDKTDNGGSAILGPETPRSTMSSRRLTRPDSVGDVVAGINR